MFIGIQWLIFIAMAITGLEVRDIPVEVNIQLKRQELIVSKIINKIRDAEPDKKHSSDNTAGFVERTFSSDEEEEEEEEEEKETATGLVDGNSTRDVAYEHVFDQEPPM